MVRELVWRLVLPATKNNNCWGIVNHAVLEGLAPFVPPTHRNSCCNVYSIPYPPIIRVLPFANTKKGLKTKKTGAGAAVIRSLLRPTPAARARFRVAHAPSDVPSAVLRTVRLHGLHAVKSLAETPRLFMSRSLLSSESMKRRFGLFGVEFMGPSSSTVGLAAWVWEG